MPPTSPSPINPSQTVERIREIIFGRQLERIEQRLERLEAAPGSGVTSPALEDRLCASEARLEAVQQSLHRLSASVREESLVRTREQQEEIQRLAGQIQQVATARAEEAALPAVRQLESRLGTWLGQWQTALQTHLNERENTLANQLRHEVATLWESTESQLTRLESRSPDRQQIEERFQRIARAARALAEAAETDTPSSTAPSPA